MHAEMGQKSSTDEISSFICHVGDHTRNANIIQKKNNNRRLTPRPHRIDFLLDLRPVDKETREQHSWNPNDRSINVFIIEEEPTTIHRYPVAQSTDCVRGRVGYQNGVHAWEITWNLRQRGTHAIVGVAEQTAPIHAYGYSSVVGSTLDSWGWDIGRKRLYHADFNRNTSDPYPFKDSKSNDEFEIPESFIMVLDMDAGNLSFIVDHDYLGVAFEGLKGKTLFPIVNVVWGHAEVTYKYLGGLASEPIYLMGLCRRTIRKSVGEENMRNVNKLPLPSLIQKYIAS